MSPLVVRPIVRVFEIKKYQMNSLSLTVSVSLTVGNSDQQRCDQPTIKCSPIDLDTELATMYLHAYVRDSIFFY